jgi:hypothetical protein
MSNTETIELVSKDDKKEARKNSIAVNTPLSSANLLDAATREFGYDVLHGVLSTPQFFNAAFIFVDSKSSAVLKNFAIAMFIIWILMLILSLCHLFFVAFVHICLKSDKKEAPWYRFINIVMLVILGLLSFALQAVDVIKDRAFGA